MFAALLAIAASSGMSDPAVSAAIQRWEDAVQRARLSAPSDDAPLAEQIRHLVRLDEVTRQNLWIMDDSALTRDEQRQVGSEIGPRLNEVDAYTTAKLKKLLPKSGWFNNHVEGRHITHGAWLIAQHSPDDAFREYALSEMSKIVRSGGVDAKDYALIYDRVRINKRLPQRYGSQMYCAGGRVVLEPIENEAKVDILREEIGWSQTLAETKGDKEVGKPCVQ